MKCKIVVVRLGMISLPAGCGAERSDIVVATTPVNVLEVPRNFCLDYPNKSVPVAISLIINAQADNGIKATSDKENLIRWTKAPAYPITINAAMPDGENYTIVSGKSIVLTSTISLTPTVYVAERGTPCSVIYGEAEERRQSLIGLRTLLALLVGGLPIGYGLLNLLAGNLLWKWHVWGMRTRGLTPERTPEWESSRMLLGIALIIGGLLLALLTTQLG